MIITTLLNFWLAISAVIDPSLAFKATRTENGEGISRTVLKKHKLLELKTIEFAEPDPAAVSRNALRGLGLMTVQTLTDVGATQFSVLQNLVNRGREAAAEKLDATNTMIMEIQAQLIIRQLNRLAEGNGNPTAAVDPYWAHYELFDTRKIVLVDACSVSFQSPSGTLVAIRMAYETVRKHLRTYASMGLWLIHKIETFTLLIENSGAARNDLRHSCKPDFVILRKEVSGQGPNQVVGEFSPTVRVANRRCNVVD